MSKVAAWNQIEETYLSRSKVAEEARRRGLEKVTEWTVQNAAYRTKKLARPKIIGGIAYWAKSDVDAWLANS
jgi:hypothetical protein